MDSSKKKAAIEYLTNIRNRKLHNPKVKPSELGQLEKIENRLNVLEAELGEQSDTIYKLIMILRELIEDE